jgi:hypothetical protein
VRSATDWFIIVYAVLAIGVVVLSVFWPAIDKWWHQWFRRQTRHVPRVTVSGPHPIDDRRSLSVTFLDAEVEVDDLLATWQEAEARLHVRGVHERFTLRQLEML